MAFASPIVLKNAADTNENFIRLNGDGQKVNYLYEGSTLSEPISLQIGHQMTTSPQGSDRHLVKISRTVIDSDNSPRTLVLNCTLSVPRVGITASDVKDAVAELESFISVNSNVDALLRGEL